MAADRPDGIDNDAIEEHAQRTAERSALRKVRKALDRIEAAETAERRTLRKVLVVCALLAVLGGWFAWWLIFSDRGMPKPPPMNLPQKLQQRQ
jgi:hypothetical protein